jgi:lysyl-tRNA synthetase class II
MNWIVQWNCGVDDVDSAEGAAIQAVRIWAELDEHALQVAPVTAPVTDPDSGLGMTMATGDAEHFRVTGRPGLPEIIHVWGLKLAKGENSQGAEVEAVGRVVSVHRDGAEKLYLMLSDGNAEVQVLCTAGRLPGGRYLDALGLQEDDVVEVIGTVTRTQRGVLTVMADQVQRVEP